MILIWILILVLILLIAMSRSSDTPHEYPSIWNKYLEYLRSERTNKIPFDIAFKAWNSDTKALEPRNSMIPKKAESSIRIATWNVHQWRDANGSPSGDITPILNAMDADILCLQEATPIQTSYPYSYVAWVIEPAYANIIYSKYPIKLAHVIELLQIVPERRICVHAIIQTPVGSVHIFNTHLEVKGGHDARAPQIDTILDNIRLIRGPVVLMGDFNVGLVDDSDREFHAHIDELENAVLITKNKNTSRSSSIYGGFVDHIYVRGLNVTGTYEYFTNASDHYPVIADVSINSQ